jgi:phytoene desaturase
MSENNKIAVIGAGLAGIACAIRLAKTGYKVIVFEKNKTAGGKIEELKGKGFRFDTGASILTLPELIKDIFECAGEDIQDYLKFKKLKINSRFFYPDGTTIDAFQDNTEFAKTIEKTTGENSRKIAKYLKRNQRLYDLTAGIFVFSPFHNIKSIPIIQALKVVVNIFSLKIFTTMHTLNKKWFKDERVIQLFDRYAIYNGSNPFQAPATLSLISHLEHNIGSYFPEKGMYQLITALVSLAKKLGVEFQYNADVQKIEIDK